MILATRIPQLTARMYAATVRATAEQRNDTPGNDEPVRQLVEYLERRGYQVIPPRRAA